MGRPKRYIASDTTYHTYSRCINKEDLLKKDFVKSLLITVIKETLDLYCFELNTFEILDNHIHFVITTRNDEHTISKIMQRIKSVFARRFNKLKKRSGPFWNERYGCKVVETFPPLNAYIGYNPVRKGAVSKPGDSYYSSYKCYTCIGYQPLVKITLHQQFIDLGDTPEKRIEAVLCFEQRYIDP